MTDETSATPPQETPSASERNALDEPAAAHSEDAPALPDESAREAVVATSATPREAGVERQQRQRAPRVPIQVGALRSRTDASSAAGPGVAVAEPAQTGKAPGGHKEGARKKSDEPASARDVPPQTVPPPSRRDALSAELEREVEAALGDVSLDSLVTTAAPSAASPELESDARIRAAIVRIHGDNVFFSLGGRNEGVISLRQFREPPAVGDELEVVVRGYHAEEGLYDLHFAGAAVQVGDWSDLIEGTVVEARITGANTGGLECMVGNIRGFIPSSQIGLFRVENFAEYLGQKLPCVATEVNPKRRNLVVSHRAYLEREREESRRQLMASLQPGQTVEGIVRNLRDFGAFVDLGGVDGLIHVSQLSWERVQHPREVLQEGQKIRVKIEKVNPETGKISLAYRDLLDHPWVGAEEKYLAGSIVKGPVSRIAKFGAFVKLAPGVEGLIHISELAHHRVRQVSDVVSEGQEVEAKVISVDVPAQRIALSLKAAQPEPEPAADAQPETHDEPKRELVRARRKSPLKGGVDRPSGGEQFGLRW